MSDALRKLARGKDCFARIPGVCNFNPETTILAHIRRGGVGGMGIKPSNFCAIFCCSSCHDAIDRRTHREIPMEVINDYILIALCQQLDWYDKHEIIAVVL